MNLCSLSGGDIQSSIYVIIYLIIFRLFIPILVLVMISWRKRSHAVSQRHPSVFSISLNNLRKLFLLPSNTLLHAFITVPEKFSQRPGNLLMTVITISTKLTNNLPDLTSTRYSCTGSLAPNESPFTIQLSNSNKKRQDIIIASPDFRLIHGQLGRQILCFTQESR